MLCRFVRTKTWKYSYCRAQDKEKERGEKEKRRKGEKEKVDGERTKKTGKSRGHGRGTTHEKQMRFVLLDRLDVQLKWAGPTTAGKRNGMVDASALGLLGSPHRFIAR